MTPPRNLCVSCGRDFASIKSFDRHRTGVHAYTFLEGMEQTPPVEDGRRCMDEPELLKAGLQLDARGLWQDVKRAEHARARFRHSPGAAPGV